MVSRPTTIAAVVLTLIAVGAAVAYLAADAVDAWMPNVAIGAVSIAITITLVEGIVRREARVRLRPRLERTANGLRNVLEGFCVSATLDYADTHLRGYRPIPTEMLSFLEQWLMAKEQQDVCPPARGVHVIQAGFRLADELRRYRAEDREVMEPDLVRAIDDYITSVTAAQHLFAFSEVASGADCADAIRYAEEHLVRGAATFGAALARWDTGRTLEFTSGMAEIADWSHSRLVRAAEKVCGLGR
jgi:hypothetical protein